MIVFRPVDHTFSLYIPAVDSVTPASGPSRTLSHAFSPLQFTHFQVGSRRGKNTKHPLHRIFHTSFSKLYLLVRSSGSPDRVSEMLRVINDCVTYLHCPTFCTDQALPICRQYFLEKSLWEVVIYFLKALLDNANKLRTDGLVKKYI